MMCPRGWTRDKEATDDMPRWIHQLTGAGQWDFPNLMKLEITTMQGQPLQPSTMEVWINKARISWAPINCNMETLLYILLQQHPLGSLTEFRNNSMVALQQHSPQGTTLTPHFFNHGDTEGERKIRKISHLINRATSLQIPGTPKRSRHSYPCQDTDSHPARTGTSRRPELFNGMNLCEPHLSHSPSIRFQTLRDIQASEKAEIPQRQPHFYSTKRTPYPSTA